VAIPNLMALALVGIPPARFSTGIAVYTVFRQIGSALGLAIWVAAIGTASLAAASSYRTGWLMITLLALVALAALLSVARTARAAGAYAPVTAGARTSRT
jgi:hypothetical protein